jgi:hypothetical protein
MGTLTNAEHGTRNTKEGKYHEKLQKEDAPESGIANGLALVRALVLLGLEVLDRETSNTTVDRGGGDNPLLGLLELVLLGTLLPQAAVEHGPALCQVKVIRRG